MSNTEKVNSVSAVDVTDGREAHSKFWIAVYTRPRSEKKTALELSKTGIKTYVATQLQIRQWSDRKKNVETVVIPMLVFLYVTETDIEQIDKHPLIIKTLSFPGDKRAAHIPTEQIEKLKYILGQSDIPVNYDPDIVKVNDSVRVTRGKLRGLHGEVTSCSDSICEIIIQIDLLGGARLKIPKTDIEVI